MWPTDMFCLVRSFWLVGLVIEFESLWTELAPPMAIQASLVTDLAAWPPARLSLLSAAALSFSFSF